MNLSLPASGLYQPSFDAHLFSLPGHDQPRWYAAFTLPQNEKAVARRLCHAGIETFLPTYECLRVWKNRQRRTLVLPLFPTYVFVRIPAHERARVLQVPGVVYIVGNARGPLPLPDAEVELLQSEKYRGRLEPYSDLVIGQKVRVRGGVLQGVEGVLVRKSQRLRFVLRLALIHQHASIEVQAEDLEPIAD